MPWKLSLVIEPSRFINGSDSYRIPLWRCKAMQTSYNTFCQSQNEIASIDNVI